MALVGYARVSSVGQTLEVQLDKLNHVTRFIKRSEAALRLSAPNSMSAWTISGKEHTASVFTALSI
jgi:hypothetical protein